MTFLIFSYFFTYKLPLKHSYITGLEDTESMIIFTTNPRNLRSSRNTTDTAGGATT
jgi:hypothetical protein